jgi:hypothetical protein
MEMSTKNILIHPFSFILGKSIIYKHMFFFSFLSIMQLIFLKGPTIASSHILASRIFTRIAQGETRIRPASLLLYSSRHRQALPSGKACMVVSGAVLLPSHAGSLAGAAWRPGRRAVGDGASAPGDTSQTYL